MWLKAKLKQEAKQGLSKKKQKIKKRQGDGLELVLKKCQWCPRNINPVGEGLLILAASTSKAQSPLVWSLVQGSNNKFRSEDLRFPNKALHAIIKLLNCILRHRYNIRQVELCSPKEKHVADRLGNKLNTAYVTERVRVKMGPLGYGEVDNGNILQLPITKKSGNHWTGGGNKTNGKESVIFLML